MEAARETLRLETSCSTSATSVPATPFLCSLPSSDILAIGKTRSSHPGYKHSFPCSFYERPMLRNSYSDIQLPSIVNPTGAEDSFV
jgi:hypothetical protein